MIGRRRLDPVIVFVAALALYLVTLAPTLTVAHSGADGGDLVSAIATRGVPHPPGYPTYLVLGSLFAQLPIGSIAFRLNLFSAVCMALAAALMASLPGPSPVDVAPLETSTREGSKHPPLFAALRERARAGAERRVGVLAGLTFATAPMVWGQATIAEVHALNALFVAVILVLLTPIVFRVDTVPTSRLLLAFFICGLGLGNQLTLLALLPLFVRSVRVSRPTPHASLVIAQHPRGTRHLPAGVGARSTRRVTLHSSRLTHYSLLIIAFLLGLSIYLLIPLRAATQPPINWLGEVTPPNVVNFLTAEIYRGYAFAVPLIDLPARLIAFAQTTVAQFGWIGMALAAFGVWRVIARQQRGLGAMILSMMLYLIFSLGYNTPDSDLYLIPIWLFGAWAIAVGAQRLLHRVPAVIRLPSSVLLLLLIPGLNVSANYAAHDLQADRSTEIFAEQVWAQSPRNAMVITHLDAQTFTLWYYRLVERQRPDVTVIDARLAAYEWSASMQRAQDARLNLVPYDPEDTWLDRLRAANPLRPVCEIDAATNHLRCP